MRRRSFAIGFPGYLRKLERPTTYQQKRNGNMLVAQEQRLRFTLAKRLRRIWRILMVTISTEKHQKENARGPRSLSIPSPQTPLDSTTRTEMSGNGALIHGMTTTTALQLTAAFGMPLMIPDLIPGSVVAVRGAATLTIVALPIGSTAIRRTSAAS